jgi:hypothetical protein
MPRRVRVKLDLRAIRANLEREGGGPVTEQDVTKWLSEAGFTRADPEHWIVLESHLGHVDASEVLEAEPLE